MEAYLWSTCIQNTLLFRSHLVMVLHQLYDDSDVVGVVLDGDDPHDVGCVLGVGILAVLVGQHQARVRLMNL